jgi:hydrogenase/urease accessory protein HupE
MKKIVLFFLLTIFLNAHQTGLSYLNITEEKNAQIDITYKKPLEDVQASNDISINFHTKCVQQSAYHTTVDNGFVIDKYQMWCGEKGLNNSRIWIDGLVKSDKGFLVKYTNKDFTKSSLLKSDNPFILINYKHSNYELFKQYTELGIEHILIGFDHLLFVLALILLVQNLKVLLYAITAFTLSHSITLALAIFDIVPVNVAYVEAMIALSIVFLSRELLSKNDLSLTKKYLPSVTFIFGLLHGFGFSSVLKDIGIDKEDIVLSLFSFNLGIEIGQVIFILFVSIILFVAKKFIKEYKRYIFIPTSYAIGSISAFWLIDRVISF